MIKVEKIFVYNIANAVYSARNALNSWDKSDSDLKNDILGENDLALAKRLYKAGSSHRKYLRQIFVSMDITAPLYFWKEMDQYRINVTSNSCSTMHTIHKKEFELDDFSHEHLITDDDEMFADDEFGYTADIVLKSVISNLNFWRTKYLKYKDKKYWWQMIQLLPSSYNQKRTVTMNYENVINIISQRSNHKLDEWHEFCDILRDLPYIKEIMEETNE